jgi:hypothetical protein
VTAPPGPDREAPRPDPVRARRARIARWSRWANRLGYLVLTVAVVVFVIGFGAGFTSALVTTVVAGLVVASLLLVPSIVLGYAVRAAERDDRDHGR